MRTRRSALSCLVASLLTCSLVAPSALAQPVPPEEDPGGLEASLAILELYMAETYYDKTPEYVDRTIEEINKIGDFALLDRADAARQIASVMTTSSRRVTDEKLQEIERLMKKGDELLYTQPRQAISILAEAKAELQTIMENMSLNQKIREDYFRTQMMLARSHYDNSNPEKAAAILEEIIRVFGDSVKVTEEEYHPNVVGLYRETYRRLAAEEKGSVLVRTDPPGAEVYVHGTKQKQTTPATFEGLYPGVVTVQAVKDGMESMIHKVEIKAGAPAELTIDIGYETSLSFNDKRFGFTFVDREQLKKSVGPYASRIGKLLNVDKVLVCGLVDLGGRTHLEGYLVNVSTQQVERSESLFTKPNVVSKNRVAQISLAMSKGNYVIQTVYKPWYTNVLGWTGAGVGVVATIVGAVLWADFESKLDEVNCVDPNNPACKSHQERIAVAADADKSRTFAGISFVVGGVAIAGGVAAWLFMREEDPDADVSAATLPDVPQLQLVAPTVMPDGSPGLGATFTF